VVLVELEGKFCNMCKSNWEKVSAMPQLGYEMGQCNIIQGDARQLEGLVDKIVTSPPFADARSARTDTEALKLKREWEGKGGSRFFDARQGDNPNNISNLPYGQIDKIVTSPPFGEAQSGGGIARKGYQGPKHTPTDLVGKRSYMPENIGDQDNISNLPYGNIDSIITSPPYEGSAHEPSLSDETIRKTEESQGRRYTRRSFTGAHAYSSENDNIGNLKSDSYLEAMLQVYQQCHKVLKPEGGLLILVTKNFIREKKLRRVYRLP